jgi:hypothetical protein
MDIFKYHSWQVRAAIFVRRENRERFKQGLSPACAKQVDVFSIEECVFPKNALEVFSSSQEHSERKWVLGTYLVKSVRHS